MSRCSAFQDEAPLKTGQFTEVYTRLVLSAMDSTDTEVDRLNATLDTLGISRQDFEHSLYHYKGQPIRWIQIITHAIQELEKQDSSSAQNPAPK